MRTALLPNASLKLMTHARTESESAFAATDDLTWAAARPCPYTTLADSAPLSLAWLESVRRFEQLRSGLLDPPLPANVVTVAVSGSLSRMEADADSDLDLLIVVDDRQNSADLLVIFDHVWQRLDVPGLKPAVVKPKPGGIFSSCVSWRKVIDRDRRGIIDDDLAVFGQRMQLLMDAQPLIRPNGFAEVQRSILQWYQEDRIRCLFAESNPFHWLWQDVQRYWRSLRSRACWLSADDAAVSLEVNFKLRFSRLVLMAALLAAIARCPDDESTQAKQPSASIRYLQRCLTQTPLERLAAFGSTRQGDDSTDVCPPADRLIQLYQRAWTRSRILRQQPALFSDEDRDLLHELNSVVRKIAATDSEMWWF